MYVCVIKKAAECGKKSWNVNIKYIFYFLTSHGMIALMGESNNQMIVGKSLENVSGFLKGSS